MGRVNLKGSGLTFATAKAIMSAMLKTAREAVGFPRDASSVSHEDDPIALFQDWFRDAFDSGMKEPSAMTVATVDPSGYPDARMMLLKGVDDRGFVFYTNVRSAKALAVSVISKQAAQ